MPYGYVGSTPAQNKRTGNKGVLTFEDIILLKDLDQLNGWGDDMLKIATSDITNQASIDFTDCDYTRDYLLVWNNVTFSASGGYFNIRVSNNNGVSWQSSAEYTTALYHQRGTSDTYSYVTSGSTSARIGNSSNNGTGNCFNGWVYMDGYRDFDHYSGTGMKIQGLGANIDTSATTAIEANRFSSRFTYKPIDINAIQVYSSTASMSGRFTLYQMVWED
jgi:hypothetical protein